MPNVVSIKRTILLIASLTFSTVLEGISTQLQRNGVTYTLSIEGGLTCVLPEEVAILFKHFSLLDLLSFISVLTSLACNLFWAISGQIWEDYQIT